MTDSICDGNTLIPLTTSISSVLTDILSSLGCVLPHLHFTHVRLETSPILYLISGNASFCSIVTTTSPFSPSLHGFPFLSSISIRHRSAQTWTPFCSLHSRNMGP